MSAMLLALIFPRAQRASTYDIPLNEMYGYSRLCDRLRSSAIIWKQVSLRSSAIVCDHMETKFSVKTLILFVFFFSIFIAFLLNGNLTCIKMIAWIPKIANWFGFSWKKVKHWKTVSCSLLGLWYFHPRELVCNWFYLFEQAYSLIFISFASLIVKLLFNGKTIMGLPLLRS